MSSSYITWIKHGPIKLNESGLLRLAKPEDQQFPPAAPHTHTAFSFLLGVGDYGLQRAEPTFRQTADNRYLERNPPRFPASSCARVNYSSSSSLTDILFFPGFVSCFPQPPLFRAAQFIRCFTEILTGLHILYSLRSRRPRPRPPPALAVSSRTVAPR
jgi:hypothetical protein